MVRWVRGTIYLLSIAGNVGVALHIKLDVLERCTLSNLPVDSTDRSILICETNIHFEVSNASEKVRLDNILFYVVTDIDITRDDSQINKAWRSENSRHTMRLQYVRKNAKP